MGLFRPITRPSRSPLKEGKQKQQDTRETDRKWQSTSVLDSDSHSASAQLRADG